MFESILCQVTEYDPDVLESLIGLAVEIALALTYTVHAKVNSLVAGFDS